MTNYITNVRDIMLCVILMQAYFTLKMSMWYESTFIDNEYTTEYYVKLSGNKKWINELKNPCRAETIPIGFEQGTSLIKSTSSIDKLTHRFAKRVLRHTEVLFNLVKI